MKKTIVYLGLNDKDERRQLISTGDALEQVARVFSDYVDGATISEAKGVYTHEDGGRVIETTLRVELFQAIDGHILEACGILKQVFNQESLAIEEVETNTNFI